MIFLELGPLYNCCLNKVTVFTAAFITMGQCNLLYPLFWYGLVFFFRLKPDTVQYMTTDNTCWQSSLTVQYHLSLTGLFS